MTDFIKAFKNTSYYRNIFKYADTEIILIYIGGSRNSGLTDERSDYDIIVLTLDGDFIDVSSYEHLKYRDTKVHWYYQPINILYKADKSYILSTMGVLLLKNLCDDLIIYENPKYKDLINNLLAMKEKVSSLGAYRLFDIHKELVNKVITEGKLIEEHYTKFLYHLCLASYYIMKEEPDKDFLKSLKRIRWAPVSEEYKQLAVDRLMIYNNFMEHNPVSHDLLMSEIYDQLEIEKYKTMQEN